MLPNGVTVSDVWAVLIPIGIITVFLRWIPFAATKRLRDSSIIEYLLLGVMFILVVYTYLGQRSAPGGLIAATLALAFTIGIHWWKRSAGLSILGGTLFNKLLVNDVF
ncbi:AzlD domain-containing protein [uncultured Corynebacterium sp.]|uniref:branched-chain amino acid transporter permease n=1 Tax=uncultured Corynebacterium sp. TaxID=159447 RepID=UPI002633480B|nr:AzlD domain-containing protein [uncultured Corynebacterium sp.]